MSRRPPVGRAPSDQELVIAWQGGVLEARDQLLARYHQLVRRRVRAHLADQALTEDVAQQVFVAVIRGIDRLRETEHFAGWLARIVRRCLIDAYERQRTEGERLVPLDALPSDRGTVVSPDDGLLADDLLRLLPPEVVRVVELRGWWGLTDAEIAAHLGVSVRTVERRFARARALLRRPYADERGDG